MNLGLHISRLLPEFETVIVPGLGAFIAGYKPAQINRENDEILPPSTEISFNPKIRNNDNLLVNYVALQDNITHLEALNKIEKEREDILYRLDKGEEVTLEKLGVLHLNESQEIQFEAFGYDNLLLESFGLGALSLKDEPEDGVQEESFSGPEETIVLPPEEKIEAAFQEQEFQPVEKTEPWYADESNNKDKKRSWLWLLLILIPLTAAGIYIFLNQEKEPSAEVDSVNVQQQQPVASQSEDAGIVESLPDSAVTDSVLSASEPAVTDILSGSKYYLIGGSFKDEENAEKYLQQLKNAGYEPFHLGKRGNYYLIGIGTYASETDALSAQDSFFEKNNGSGAWVYEE